MASENLTASGLRKAFGAHIVLDDVNLSIEQGSVVGLLGPNGSGKSTLLNVLTGFVQKDGGRVTLGRSCLDDLTPSAIARLGLVRTFQLPQMPMRMSVRETLLSADRSGAGLLEAWGIRRSSSALSVDNLLERLSLTRVAEEPAGAISGGQKKLLSIAMALSSNPRILCLDEPTAGVHPNLRREIINLLKEAKGRGLTLLIVEHDMAFVRGLCERCVVLDRGNVIADCGPAELAAHPRVVEAYLGKAAESFTQVAL